MKWKIGKSRDGKVCKDKYCKFCREKMQKKDYHMSYKYWLRTVFCGKDCWYKYKKDKIRSKLDSIKMCSYCGGDFPIYKYQIDDRIFCKRECFDKSRIIEGSRFPYSDDFNVKLKRYIAKRDNYICQVCGEKVDNGAVHHIHYCKQDTRPEFLVWLHRGCHSKTNYDRDYWFAYFCNILKLIPDEVYIFG
jgi:hypothetical protein